MTQCQVFPDVIMSRTSAMRLGCQEKVKPGVFTHKLLFSLHQSRYYRLVWQFCQCQPIRGHLNSFWPIRSLHLCTTHIKQTRLLAAPSQPTSHVFGALLNPSNGRKSVHLKREYLSLSFLQISNIRDQIYVGH